jgi:hypothetical protein
MPLHYRGRNWWISARLVTDTSAPGLSVSAIEDHIRRTGVEFDIEQACGMGEFEPLARLRLQEVIPGTESDIAFDPTTNTAPGVQPFPRWLTDLRRNAYQRSREGRTRSASHPSAG